MDIETLSNAANRLLFEKTGQHLSTLEKAVLQGALEHKSYKALAATTYRSAKTLKDVGAQLWQKLAIALDTPIKKSNIRAELERCVDLAASPLPQPRRDWADAPEGNTFYGRQAELATLRQWILQDRCRLVAIVGMRGIGKTGLAVRLGMGGVGKTDLSLHLARGIQDEFDCVIWRSLLNAPLVHDLLRDLIHFLSNHSVNRLPETVEEKTSYLLQRLKTRRCLIVLDNLESVLESCSTDKNTANNSNDQIGQYRAGYEGYAYFLQKIGEVFHQSCLIITSREQPKHLQTIASNEGKTRFLKLAGLDMVSAKKVLTSQQILTASNRELEKVIAFYEGNPLALNLVLRRVKSIFNGNLSEFIRDENPYFGDINELLGWHFDRLTDAEREVLYWLAVNREPTSISALKENSLSPIFKEKVTDIIEGLCLSFPIHRTFSGFSLQPVIIEYLTAKLIETSCQEICSKEISLLNQICLHQAFAKSYVRNTQARLLLVPLIDHLLASFQHESAVVEKLKEIIVLAQKSLSLKSGYVAGNIISLLRQMGADFSGQDFSHLAIRQVSLQSTSLRNVDFSHCDLSTAMFIRSFGGVHAVAFSPDNQHLAIGDCKGNVRLLQRGNCQQMTLFAGHQPGFWITFLAFSPNNSFLASSSFDKTVRVWDLNTGRCINTLEGHTQFLWAVAISPDSRWIASSGDDCTVRLWDANTGNCENVFSAHTNWVWAVAFHPAGHLLASGSHDCTIRLWDLETRDCIGILEVCASGVWVLVFSPDGKTLASSGSDCLIRLWNMETQQCFQTLKGHTKEIRSLVFTPNGEFLISGSFDGSIRMWEMGSGRCTTILSGHTVGIRSVDISPDSEMIVSGDHSQSLRVWETSTGRCLQTLKGYVNWIWSVDFNPETQAVVAGSLDGRIHLWNLQKNDSHQVIKGHGNWIWQVKYSPCKQYFASGSCTNEETLKLWHASNGQCLAVLEGHTDGGVWTIDFSPDGRSLISGGQDGTIRYWNLQTYACTKILEAHRNWIWSVLFTADGKRFASCSDDGTIKVWETETGHLQQTIAVHGHKVMSLKWLGKGDTIAAGYDDGVIRLWEASTGNVVATLTGHQYGVLALAFNQNDCTLISGAQDGVIRFWNLENESCFAVLTEHNNWVTSITLNCENNLLLTGGADGSVRIWDLATRECLRQLRLPLPYDGMNISHATGLTDSQKTNLQLLGAIVSDV